MNNIGKQYEKDDVFKAQARLHQSRYRANELKVDFNEYGNRLNQKDAENLLAYYHELGVQQCLRARYKVFSQKRDGDLLRSEHIVFNLIAPLMARKDVCLDICNRVFGVNLISIDKIKFEHWPTPKSKYLDDATAFDAYIEGKDSSDATVGIGIEVKYTEKSYPPSGNEPARLKDPDSTYWRVSQDSGIYKAGSENSLASDELRQIWRNHLLGISMKLNGTVSEFHSVTLYPSGNLYVAGAVDNYVSLLVEEAAHCAKKVSYETFIDALQGGQDIGAWKAYLKLRYLVGP